MPQGSTLAPLLFLLYMNDLPNSSSKLSCYLLVDDINIYFESDSLRKLQEVVNRELTYVKEWPGAIRLALNVDETSFIIFHFPQSTLEQTVGIKIGKEHVKQAKDIKFLGLLLDQMGS